MPVLICLAVLAIALGGCDRTAGPAHLRIETGGEAYDDFVIVPIRELGRLHSSDMVPMAGIVDVATPQPGDRISREKMEAAFDDFTDRLE